VHTHGLVVRSERKGTGLKSTSFSGVSEASDAMSIAQSSAIIGGMVAGYEWPKSMKGFFNDWRASSYHAGC
jgi:hypothetical protein